MVLIILRPVTGEKNSPTVAHACRKRRLKWVLGAWGYNWATQSSGYINMETWSSRLGVGRGADYPTPEKSQQLGNLRFGLGTVRSIGDDWERSIKEAKVRIGL
jgi:hypothetical protein